MLHRIWGLDSLISPIRSSFYYLLIDLTSMTMGLGGSSSLSSSITILFLGLMNPRYPMIDAKTSRNT